MRAEPWEGCAGGPLSDDEARDAWQYAVEPADDRPDAFDLAGLGDWLFTREERRP